MTTDALREEIVAAEEYFEEADRRVAQLKQQLADADAIMYDAWHYLCELRRMMIERERERRA